jgi:hypothetical protein
MVKRILQLTATGTINTATAATTTSYLPVDSQQQNMPHSI